MYAALLVVCLLACQLKAACQSNVLWSYEPGLQVADLCGNYGDLTNTNSVPTGVSSPAPCSGSLFSGPFATSDTVTATTRKFTLPANALAALTATGTSYTIVLCLQDLGVLSSPVYISDASTFFIQTNTSSQLRWSVAGGIVGPGGVSVTTGTNYVVAVTSASITKTVLINWVTYLNNLDNTGSIAGLTQFRIGQYNDSGDPLYGYIGRITAYNQYMLTDPGDPIVAANSNQRRGLELENDIFIDLFSWVLQSSAARVLAAVLGPVRLSAQPGNSYRDALRNVSSGSMSEARRQRGPVTTPVPSRGTPTITPTVTPTATLTR